ncbi:MAG: ABC transporter ATP-binding protein [Mycetocola sp.]
MYTLSALSKTYAQGKNTITALNRVDLTIPDGQMVAVQGPTGGGKSTLLQMLGALDRPTSGSIVFGDSDLSSLGESALTAIRAEKVGIVFQSFNLIPTLTAQENVEMALVPLTRTGAERSRRASEALASVGLGDRGRHRPAELSGGQQQRVAIARAIVKNPSVLLADEPTGALDEDTRDDIMALLEKLWAELGLTLIIVTHDSAVAKRAQRRLHITNGQLKDITQG